VRYIKMFIVIKASDNGLTPNIRIGHGQNIKYKVWWKTKCI